MGLRSLRFGTTLFAAGIAASLSLGCAGKGASPTGTAGQTGSGARGGSSAAGTSGGAGTTGTTGAAGTTATSGSAGTTGTTGAAGTTATSGSAGTTGTTGLAGTNGVAGTTGSTGTAGTGASDAGTDVVCQMAEFKFEPKIPTVYLMVDRSGSMFGCLGSTDPSAPPCADHTNTAWGKLQPSILQVVMQLQDQVRFGFAAYNGVSGGTCPDIRRVAPAVMNYQPIANAYSGLPFRGNNDKWETPTRRTLEMLGSELGAITAPGDKYILLVTDGEPDYCGDGNTLCPPDAVVGELQTLKTNGIKTIIFGIQSSLTTLPPNTLQAFANAGAGETTVAPLTSGANIVSIFDQCFPGGDSSTAGWRADFLAVAPQCATNSNNCRGMTIGTYGTTPGPTKPYTPDPSNQAQLVQQLSTAISGVKSCTFDLSDVNGKSIKVDQTKLDQAKILVMGTAVPRNDTNGWKVDSTGKVLELVGTACTNWRMPNVNTIDFQFPCSTIIFE